MKKLIILAALMLPSVAHADSLDVISSRLKEGCSVAKYVALSREFNETWGKANGYIARIVVPVQSPDSSVIGWVGPQTQHLGYILSFTHPSLLTSNYSNNCENIPAKLLSQ